MWFVVQFKTNCWRATLIRITGSDIVYSTNGHKGDVSSSIRSHRHHGNHGKNSGGPHVRKGKENPMDPYLLHAHSFDDPRFKMEYLLLSNPHADLLLTSHSASTTEKSEHT